MAGYGNVVVIYHEDEDLWVVYAHLHSINVEPGMRVEAGHVLGTVGNTSNRRFPGMAVHLHLEVRERSEDGGAPIPGPYRVNNINPQTWLASHGVEYDRRGHFVGIESTETFADAEPVQLALAAPSGAGANL